ncbi:SDR family oxidoreductase [bacterium]|nr:SDR family oxidoreductase [bacterium]
MNKVALITGASGGIGLELARVFARDGVNLVLAARNREKLDSLAAELSKAHAVEVRTIAVDLSEAGSAQRLFEETTRDNLEIDYLVNNAGFGKFGRFVELPTEEVLAMLELNCRSLTVLSQLFGRTMNARRSGRILNVASTAAFLPGPLMAVYYASKSYVLMLSEALNNEFRGSGVTVTCLCPGPTPTGFQARAGNRTSGVRAFAATSAEQVAMAGYRGMLRGKSVVVPGVVNKVITLGVRCLPRDVVTALSRFVSESR